MALPSLSLVHHPEALWRVSPHLSHAGLMGKPGTHQSHRGSQRETSAFAQVGPLELREEWAFVSIIQQQSDGGWRSISNSWATAGRVGGICGGG